MVSGKSRVTGGAAEEQGQAEETGCPAIVWSPQPTLSHPTLTHAVCRDPAEREAAGLAGAGWPTPPLYRAPRVRWDQLAQNTTLTPSSCHQRWKFMVCLPSSVTTSVHAPAVVLL